jgi:hypothetical protein
MSHRLLDGLSIGPVDADFLRQSLAHLLGLAMVQMPLQNAENGLRGV